MGDVVELRPDDPDSSPSHWNGIPDWPHPRRVTLSIQQARAIDRDIRHLEAVIRRVRDVRTISTIVSTICSAERAKVERAVRTISAWLRTGQLTRAGEV